MLSTKSLAEFKQILLLAGVILLGCYACEANRFAPSGPSEEQNASKTESIDVVLLEKETVLSNDEIFLTIGSDLVSPGFRDKVYSQIKASFLGFALTSAKTNNGFVFSSPLKIFNGKYFMIDELKSSGWPREEFKDEHWQDLRGSAQAITQLDRGLSDTFRIYYFPARIGFESNEFLIEHGLLITKIDANSGKLSAFLFKNEKVFALTTTPFPDSIAGVSLVAQLEAGLTVKADVTGPNGRIEKDKAIPAKLFNKRSYKPGLEKEEESLGSALDIDTSAFRKILQGYLNRDKIDKESYDALISSLK